MKKLRIIVKETLNIFGIVLQFGATVTLISFVVVFFLRVPDAELTLKIGLIALVVALISTAYASSHDDNQSKKLDKILEEVKELKQAQQHRSTLDEALITV